MDLRQQRGKQIAESGQILRVGTEWVVPSQSGGKGYRVDPDSNRPSCTCTDHVEWGNVCKHIHAVRHLIALESRGIEVKPSGEPIPRAKRPTYRQDWPAYNTAQTREKGLFQRLLYNLCRSLANDPEAKRGRGRPPIPLPDRVFAAAFKVYSTVSCRRFSCDLSDAHEKGYLSTLPHYNSVFNVFGMPALTPILGNLIIAASLPLKAIETSFAVDSSGFTTSRFVRWYDQKYGRTRVETDWVKVHLMCGVKTNIVTAVDIRDRNANDAPVFPPLVQATARNFRIDEVSADKIYSTRENLAIVAHCGGTPFIAFKASATDEAGGLWAKMFHYFSLNREDFMSHYHQRSNVESTFSMIKAKFGDHLRSKTDVAMVNEALCKILCHNICCLIQSVFELGIDLNLGAENRPTNGLRIFTG